MLYDGRRHRSILTYPALKDRAIMLDGWSKTYAMTGWRLGYAVWPAALAPVATRLAINCHSCVNAPAQFAGIAALEGPKDAVTAMTEAFDDRRKAVHAALNRLDGFSCIEPAGAFYAFPNISGHRPQRRPPAGSAAGTGRCRDHRRNQFRHSRRGLSQDFLCEFEREYPDRNRPDRGNLAYRLRPKLMKIRATAQTITTQHTPVTVTFR